MRLKRNGKCLIVISFFIICVICNAFIKLFSLHSSQAAFDTSPKAHAINSLESSLTGREKVDNVTQKKCEMGELTKCQSLFKSPSQANVEVPSKDRETLAENYPKKNISRRVGEDVTKVGDTDYHFKKPNAMESLEYMQQGQLFQPKDFVDVPKINFKKTKKHARKVVRVVFPKDGDSYTPQKLQQRIDTMRNDSVVKKYVEAQKLRQLAERHYCSHEFQKTSKKHNHNGNANILVDREFSLTFCPVYKAASTSWTVNLLTLKGMWKPKKTLKNIQMLVPEAFQKVNNLVAPWVSKGTTKFMIVRHPFYRLVSCYRDKFEGAVKLFYYERYGEKMVQIFRPRPKSTTKKEGNLMLSKVRDALNLAGVASLPGNIYADPVGPTFEEFIKYIIFGKYDDDHWRPIYIQCSMCHMSYDFVLRFESLTEDSKLFIEYLNQSSVIKTGWENPNREGTTTEPVVCSYLKTIKMDLMTLLIAKYHHDFRLFNYNPAQFLKCVSNYNKNTTFLSS